MSRFAGIAVALLLLVSPVRAQSDDLPDRVRDVFRKHCTACHDGKKMRAGLNVLNADNLLRGNRQLVKPNDPSGSELLQLVECGTMPPGTLPKVSSEDRKTLSDWIVAGARPFPSESSEEYVLTKILRDVAAAPKAQGRNPADERYVTLNHLLADKDPAALEVYRAALNQALNQLSTKPDLVSIKPIDPVETIYRIKLSDLGWDVKPFTGAKKDGIDPATVNLYDLLLLDYPLASLPDRSEVVEYLGTLNLLRPIPYVRGDWLTRAATQSPLYDDLLRLPQTLPELERRLGAGNGVQMEQVTISNSVVVNGQRRIERRGKDNNTYWRTYDFAETDPVNSVGGAAIFRLPNGLPGFFLNDARGGRLDAMPTAILREPHKKDGVRNGRSCMVCHAHGLEDWTNNGLKDLFDKDNKGFTEALQQSQRFRQQRTQVGTEGTIRPVSFDVQPRRSGIWDTRKIFHERDLPLARGEALIRPTIPPIDAIGLADVAGKNAAISFELKAVYFGTNKSATTFQPGDSVQILIKNTGKENIYFELVGSDKQGNFDVIERAFLEQGKDYRFPEKKGVNIKAPEAGEPTKQRILVFAAAEKFPDGIELNLPEKRELGYSVNARVVHPFYKIDGKQIVSQFDPGKMVRQTIEVETVTK